MEQQTIDRPIREIFYNVLIRKLQAIAERNL